GSSTSRYSPSQSIVRSSWIIFSFHLPPTRTSIATESSGFSVWPPPYQSANRSGSVHSFQTCSRGASKVRLISKLAVSVSGIRGLPFVGESLVQAAEPRLPEAPVVLDPVGRRLQRRPVDPRRPQLRLPPPGDQPGPLEHLEVLGDRLHADRK